MSPGSPFKAGEKVFCYQGPLLYEAKILSLKLEKDKTIKKLFIHYNGWSKKWDEWVSEDRVFRINDETIQKKCELESAQKKADRIKSLKRSSSKVVGKRKVSQTQENASQQNGLNPKSTCSTKRKRTNTHVSGNELENSDYEDFTKVWKGCQASKGKNEVTREPGVPFEPCPACNERQIVEAFRYKSMHKRAEQKATPHRDIIIWFKRLKDSGFEFTSIPNISNENHTSSTDHLNTTRTPKKIGTKDADLKKHQCHVCHFSFEVLSDLKCHLVTHTRKYLHTCDLCQQGFMQPNALRSHRLTHMAEKPVKCSICNRGFSTNFQCKRHIAAVHHKIRDENFFKMQQCHMCPYSSNRLPNLRRHLKIHSEERPYTCNLCQRSFSQSEYLRKHQYTHSKVKLYQCSFCNEGFTMKSSVKKHITAFHRKIENENHATSTDHPATETVMKTPVMETDFKMHQCYMCPFSFNERHDLRRHLFTHTDKRPHTCDLCQQSFAHSDALRTHRHTHVPKKRYMCSICNKGYYQSYHLKIHQYSHLAEKPFQCSICNMGFTRMESVQRHISNVHRKIRNGKKIKGSV